MCFSLQTDATGCFYRQLHPVYKNVIYVLLHRKRTLLHLFNTLEISSQLFSACQNFPAKKMNASIDFQFHLR